MSGEISPSKCREALDDVARLWRDAVKEFYDYDKNLPTKVSKEEKQRAAYLDGVVAGLQKALTAFEKRTPTRIRGSEDAVD